ncbi:hypothetical protein GCM10007415_11710 [Parapedobacter pyrenivorans]|uniref:Lipoprotein n=1 Tax=Parapedobacter pyrenivorans TaxID=1305674 RepID=A0A917HJS6_9SPHI|nr:hypothetical protein [Parapedobacter pyrenivorans]GGG80848.1 hypothetical protein GCM10007415_11710 [Parapedobacter pyrenivorans]
MKRHIVILLSLAFLACGKKDHPNPDEPGDGSEIWQPEKSQPGVFKVPDALKNHQDTHAKQVYGAINVLGAIIAEYSTYFVVPEVHTQPTGGLGDRFEYQVGGHIVSYMFGDFVDSHRVFELEVTNATGGHIMRAAGNWWEDWNADEGKTETGKHSGQLAYYIGAEPNTQTKEFSWIDDGGGNYRVELLVWSPRPNSYLTARYQYVFKADQSGDFTYWSYPPNGGGDYWRAGWTSSGEGELIKGEGENAETFRW